MKNEDIDEIIYHIQKLKEITSDKTTSDESLKDGNNKKTKKSKKQKKTTKKSIKTIDVNDDQELQESISTLEESEPISIMKPEAVGPTDESKVTCDVCEQDIVLGKNLSGLVVADEFFACENCCQHLSKEELMDWTKSKMVSANDVRPIGLWVIQQQRENNKTAH